MMMMNNAFSVLNNEDDVAMSRAAPSRVSRPTPISKETLRRQPRLAYGNLISSLASKSAWKDNTGKEEKKQKIESDPDTDNSDYYDHEYDEGPPLVWCIEKDYEYEY